MFLVLALIAIALFASGEALAAPQATATLLPLPQICTVPDYGPFKLFARRIELEADLPVRLVQDVTTDTNVTSHAFVNTNSTCVNCGVVPEYWTLKGMQLFAPSKGVTTTVNQDVKSGLGLSFITSAVSQPSYPFYCSETTGSNTPPILSAHGSSTLFYMCAFTSVPVPPTQWSIIYSPGDVQPTGRHCYPVTLIMQSIGIVPT